MKGNTDLHGAVIASDASADMNSLSTGTLSFSDIANHSSYEANSSGIGAGVAVGDGGNTYATHGNTSGNNVGGLTPMLNQNDSGHDNATTRSAISAGTINLTDPANQKQDVASLSRDTTNTNGTLNRTPDLNNLLNNQADMMAATSAAGEAVARRIGDYADAQAKATGDPAWAEGGSARAEMQAAGAALVGGLGGGVASAAGSAAGAGLASLSAGQLNVLSDSIASSSPPGNADIDRTLGNIVANVIATGTGAAVGGGSAGASSAADVDRFNRQLHPEERTLAKQIADKSGGKYTQAQVEDQMRIMGATVNGVAEVGGSATLVGQAPSDSGASWITAGQTADGKQIRTQINAAVDPQLQDYIVKNYASAAPGAVPSIVSGYTTSPTQPQIGPQYGANGSNAGTMCSKGDCGIAYKAPSQQQVADTAGFGATQLDRVSAMATALAAAGLPIPYVWVPAEAAAVWASAGSWFLNGVQQVASPNFGGYAVSNGISQVTGAITARYPIAAPILNEFGNTTSNSGAARNAQDWINTQWGTLKGKFQ